MTGKKLYLLVLAVSLSGYVWIASNVLFHNNLHLGCFFMKMTGIPCPACGSTKAIVCMLKGDWCGAFVTNPFGYFIAALMIILPVWLIADMIFRRDSLFRFYGTFERTVRKRGVYIPLIAAVAVNWIWNIIKYY
jgi:hypothetical protein